MKALLRTVQNQSVVLDLSGFDRIRESTPERFNAEIATKSEDNIQKYASENRAVMSQRIENLDREWDVDRAVMLIFPILASISVGLGLRKNRKWFGLVGLQIFFLAFHAIKGWCPPVSLLRRLGFRSRMEIDAEKYALKTLRGDFRSLTFQD